MASSVISGTITVVDYNHGEAYWVGQRPIAHRGLFSSQTPENSLAAIQHAVSQGYAVEFDVHLTNDGQFAVLHDSDIKRITGHEDRVAEISSEEISELGILGTGHNVALLHDVLETVEGKAPLLISVKGWSRGRRIGEQLLSELHGYTGDVAVSTLSPVIYWRLRRYPLDVPIGLVMSSMANRGTLMRVLGSVYKQVIQVTGALRPDFISADTKSASAGFIARMRKRGCDVIVWTVRSREELGWARRLGANVMFELGPGLTDRDLQSVLY